eukprot:m.39805 g.39805  ORF g.39805 m.39805 type:complete len:801 (+) comp14754_c0_seq2:332-2734(+)
MDESLDTSATPAMLDFKKCIGILDELCDEIEAHKSSASTLKNFNSGFVKIVASLVDDQRCSAGQANSDSTSPHLQLLLQSNLLRRLCTVGMPNVPIGIRPAVIAFLADILRNVRQRMLLQTESILSPLHMAIARMLDDDGTDGGGKREQDKHEKTGSSDTTKSKKGKQSIEVSPSAVDSKERYQRVVLLNELCARLSGDIALVDLFFIGKTVGIPPSGTAATEVVGERQFPAFAALMQYMHEPGDTGKLARDSLRLCVALSGIQPRISDYIVHRSKLCRMVVAWLCAGYSALPSKLKGGRACDWRLLGAADLVELQTYLRCLDFCVVLLQHAPPVVAQQFIGMLSHGFVIPVLRSAMLQSTAAEAIAATAYLELTIRRIPPHSMLLTPFVKMILEPGGADDAPEPRRSDVLEIMLTRLHCKAPDLTLVTLRTFVTLAALNREDVFYELCVRDLLTDKRATASVISAQQQHTAVVCTQAARAMLSLRPGAAPTASPPRSQRRAQTPASPSTASSTSAWQHDNSLEEYLHEARTAVLERYTASLQWTTIHTHTHLIVTDPTLATPSAAANSPQGFFGGLRNALYKTTTLMSPGTDASGTPVVSTSNVWLWASLMRKLRKMLRLPLKVNLLVTQLVTTLVQYSPPLWTAFIFSLHPSTSGTPTLYGTLQAIAKDIAAVESQDSFACALATTRSRAPGDGDIGTKNADRIGRGNDKGSATTTSVLSPPAAKAHRGFSRDVSRSPVKLQRQSTEGHGSTKPNSKLTNGAIIFEELLRELAAVALEQSILPPRPAKDASAGASDAS